MASSPIIPGLGFAPSSRGSQSWTDPTVPSVMAPGKRPRLTGMKARKAKKVAGATSAKRTKIRSLKSLIDASSERQCYLSARHNACHIWKQKIGMHLNKWRFELGQKKEALRALKPQTRCQDEDHGQVREGEAGKKPRHDGIRGTSLPAADQIPNKE